MFEWKKLGKIFDSSEIENGDWMKEYAQVPCVLIFDKFVRVYFCCRPLPDSNGQYVSYMAYIDLDRSNLRKIIDISKKPILELGELGTFDEFGTYPISVVKHRDEIRVYYGGNTRCESVPFNAAIGVAQSRDNGNTFTKVASGPVLSYSYDEPFVLGSPKVRVFNDCWYLWYAAGKKWLKNEGSIQPVYKIRMATSTNGMDWVKHGKDLLANVLEENECQASADVTYSNGKYHMFFSYRYNFGFKAKGRGYRIGYSFSDDLINWTRDDARAGLDVSKEGWDSETVSYAHVFKLDDIFYMLYQGNGMGKAGFGLAQLTSDLK